jgi:hypothetical protein
VIGAIGCTILGVLALTRANGVVWQLLGVWLVGAGVNYVPLALPPNRSRGGAGPNGTRLSGSPA